MKKAAQVIKDNVDYIISAAKEFDLNPVILTACSYAEQNPSDPYGLINPDVFEVTNYINDINQEYTQVLMITDVDGNYRGAYTYANGETCQRGRSGTSRGETERSVILLK